MFSKRGVLILIFGVLIPLSGESSKTISISPQESDSLLALWKHQVMVNQEKEAGETLRLLLKSGRNEAELMTQLGNSFLRAGHYAEAQRAFKRAKSIDENYLEAYVGLGIAYVEEPARGLGAFYNYRRAIREAKQAVKIDSTYGPAYRLLGEIYSRFEENPEKAIGYFTRYVLLEPDNPDGLYYFGLACVRAGDYEKVDRFIAPFLNTHPEATKILPIVAQSHFLNERYVQALEVFERYLQRLDESERMFYTDISMVASDRELEEYRATPESDKTDYLQNFWNRRDSDILTRINERIIEHYRRVWYARTFFSNGIRPWDQRGKVYVRYGEPDYRSMSTRRHFTSDPNVETVRTRMATALYGPDAAYLTFTGPIFPVRSRRSPGEAVRFGADSDDAQSDVSSQPGSSVEELDADIPALPDPEEELEEIPQKTENEFLIGNLEKKLNFGGYSPVTLGNESATIPWETWTYTGIGRGFEITFTDDRGTGNFGFAPIPPPNLDADVSQLALISDFAPHVVFQNAVATIPDHYRPSFQHAPLDFYYDFAGFRGEEGSTNLEIYYAIPGEQIQLHQDADSAFAYARCAVALASSGFREIHRNAIEQTYRVSSDFDEKKGSFMPEILRLQVPPGKYELQVQVKDISSSRTGIYRQSLQVSDFSDEHLRISDIQMAATIADTGSVEKFRKGDVWIIPMPTRTYGEGQKVFVFFEIYNLKSDEFGQTRYRTQFRVRPVSESSIGALGILTSGLRSLLRNRKPQVAINYEQIGSSEDVETAYFELDLRKTNPGFKALEVTVTDLVSRQTESREVVFSYGRGR